MAGRGQSMQEPGKQPETVLIICTASGCSGSLPFLPLTVWTSGPGTSCSQELGEPIPPHTPVRAGPGCKCYQNLKHTPSLLFEVCKSSDQGNSLEKTKWVQQRSRWKILTASVNQELGVLGLWRRRQSDGAKLLSTFYGQKHPRYIQAWTNSHSRWIPSLILATDIWIDFFVFWNFRVCLKSFFWG